MRIAFFADSYKPYLSGVTNTIEILAKELRRLGHRVYILAPHYPGHQETEPDIIRFPSFAGGYPGFRLAIPYVRDIPAVDLIHSHCPFQAGLLARWVAYRRRLPLVYTFHTLFTHYVHYARLIPEPLAKAAVVAFVRAYCRGAAAIITPSAMARRVLRSWQVNEPISVIPSGIETYLLTSSLTEIRKKLRQRLQLADDDRVLLSVGRLSKEKNLPFILNAYEQLKDAKTKLVLVGGGPLEPELRKAGYLLTGEIPYPEVLQYYCLGDIFLFASLTETQGLVLAEAKLAGLPIVALFAGGLTNTIRNGVDGYLVPRNPAVFLEHVRRLLSDPQLRTRMGQAARADALERFSSSRVAKQVESLYNSLIKQ